MTTNNIPQIKEKLKKLAKIKCYSRGNFDDAYSTGVRTGKTLLARELLEMFKEIK